MRMGLVDLPPHVRENMLREEQVDRQLALADYWNKALRAHDPDLSLVWAKPGATFPLQPERWHIKRTNQGTADSYMPVVAPGGGYREPDSGIFDELGRRDLWRTRAGLDEMYGRREALEKEKERDLARKKDERVSEMAAVIKHHDTTQIHVKKGIPNGNA